MEGGVGSDEAPSALRVGCLSRVFMLWVTPTIIRGYRTPLTREDVPPLPASINSRTLAERAEILWAAEAKADKPQLWKVFFRLSKCDVALGVSASVLQGIFNVVLRPLALKVVIQSILDGDVNLAFAVLLVLGMSSIILLESLFGAFSRQALADDVASTFAASAAAMIVRKAGRISGSAVGYDESVLIGTDVLRTFENSKFVAQLPGAVSGLIGGLLVLIFLLGWGGMVGFAVCISMLMANMQMGKLSKKLEVKNLTACDIRIGLMREVLDGIKAIKFMAWEDQYIEAITKARAHEVSHLRKFRLLQASTANLGRTNPMISTCASFVAFVAFGQDLTASNAFAALAVFQSLRMPLIIIPLDITYLAQMRVSLQRMQNYLSTPVFQERVILPAESTAAAVLEDVSFKWDVNTPRVLAGVSFTVAQHGLLAVVGTVGSGKSSLLTGILGEMQTTGKVSTARSIAFVPQKPFVLSGTIRDNILMGRPYEEAWYREVLCSAELADDLTRMQDGDATEIGERGVTVSGGQQQRLAIARALYSKPQLLVADDPLAAVDGRVGNAIFAKSFESLARTGKGAVIMALNQTHLLKRFDSILYLADGKVCQQGPFQEMMEQDSSPIHNFIQKMPADDDELTAQSCDDVGAVEPPEVPLALGAASAWVCDAPTTTMTADEGIAQVVGGASGAAKLARGTGASGSTRTIVDAEQKKTGAVSFSVAGAYISAMGLGVFPLGVFCAAAASGAMVLCDRWLSHWVGEEDRAREEGRALNSEDYAVVYAGVILLLLILILLTSFIFNEGSSKAGRRLHGDCLTRLLHAPSSWFESVPSGRILSRFSADLSLVDLRLSDFTDVCVQFIFTVLAIMATVCVIVPKIIPVMFIGCVCFYYQYVALDNSNREVKRMANNALSPVLTNMSEVLRSRSLIRAMEYGDFFHARHCAFADDWTNLNYFSTAIFNWGMLAGSLISFVITTATCTMILVEVNSYDPSLAALALTYSFLLPYFLTIFSGILSFVKLTLASLERLLEYRGEDVEQEALWELPSDRTDQALSAWPSNGAVSFLSVTMSYRPGLPPAISNVSFEIRGQERVGIIGRTGAGKSSLMVLLFRISECTSGKVLIDGRDILSVGLQTLRKRLTVVPQHPLLISGSVQKNLDPFDTYPKAELLHALEQAGLKEDLLEVEVGVGGASISAGEAQLVGFARTLLRKSAVVVMDEPTSNIDAQSDKAIQKVVRSAYKGFTLLTIAHRIETVIDSDRILAMSAGQVVEFGPPSELLANPDSYLSGVIRGLGRAAEHRLRHMATSALDDSLGAIELVVT